MKLFNILKSKSNGLSVPRFQGRLYGFAWVIIEKRDPDYDGEKLIKEQFMTIVIRSLGFATTEEINVMNLLLDKIKSAHSVDDEQGKLHSIKGALEGKLVEYEKKDINRLLLNDDIK